MWRQMGTLQVREPEELVVVGLAIGESLARAVSEHVGQCPPVGQGAEEHAQRLEREALVLQAQDGRQAVPMLWAVQTRAALESWVGQ